MKFCIAVQEVLRKEIVLEADSLEEAYEKVEDAYNSEKIILYGDDLIPDPLTGESVKYMETDWHSKEEIQNMELTDLEEMI